MNIRFYAIGGQWDPGTTGDCAIGTARNSLTAFSLLDLVELKDGYAVSLHGTNQKGDMISGEFTLREAREMFTAWRGQVCSQQ